ncbi:MAG: gamma-glutamyl-gamma-aminobutyrate hydrolase family protein [Pseudobdellovibrionaceae bacterium]
MTRRILAIRHMYSASLFTLETFFKEKGFEVTYAEGFDTDISALDPLAYDAVIVLGGAMGVYEANLYPFLHDEIKLIQKCLAADHPLLGICLGAQLIAAASGKKVYKGGNGPEIGFMDIDLTPAGEASILSCFAKDKTKIMQWHGDTFDLPDNAVLLASSLKYVNQAYKIGKNCYATQFHPEFNRSGFENALVETCANIDILHLRAESHKYLNSMEKQMRVFARDLIDLWNV